MSEILLEKKEHENEQNEVKLPQVNKKIIKTKQKPQSRNFHKNFFKNSGVIISNLIINKLTQYLKNQLSQEQKNELKYVEEAINSLKAIIHNRNAMNEFIKFVNRKESQLSFQGLEEYGRNLLQQWGREIVNQDLINAIILNDRIKEDKIMYIRKVQKLLSQE